MPRLSLRMPMMSVRNRTPGHGPLPDDGVSKYASAVPSAAFTSIFNSLNATSCSGQLIDNCIPETHAMRTGFAKTAAAQFPTDHRVEVAMRNQRGRAFGLGALHQDVRRFRRPVFGAAVILDLR